MDTFLVLKICFVVLLTGDAAVSVLTGYEKVKSKPVAKTEELEWVAHFGPPFSPDEKIARQIDQSPTSLCPSGITGQFPYPPDCKRFVNCWKGRGMIQVCGPGTLFNPATGECDYPDKVKCIQDDGYAVAPQPLTSRFPVSRPPIGENPRNSRRDKEDYQVIRPFTGRPWYFGQSHLTRPTPRPTTSAKLQQPKVECPRGSSGLFPHPADCTKFLNCFGGRMFIQQCGPGTYFNPDMSVCDHALSTSNCLNDGLEHIPDRDSFSSPDERKNRENSKESVVEDAYPTEDELSNAASNLFDVRSGVEEDPQEPEESKQVDNIEAAERKDRDPSWGKILNWGNRKQQQQPENNKLFYDANGNPVNPNQFWAMAGKPHSTQPQSEQNQTGKGQSTPGDSNVYYLRPHNHVMNQYPPNLQNNWAAQHPIFHNPQSFHQNVREGNPTFNPYFPTAPRDTAVPGHFILVDDKQPTSPQMTHEVHQTNNEPPTYLVPPRQDFNAHTYGPQVTDHFHTPDEPSRVLLPPAIDVRTVSNNPPRNDQVNLDYSNWKPLYNEPHSPHTPRVPTRNQETSPVSHRGTSSDSYNQNSLNDKRVPPSRDHSDDRWKVHYSKVVPTTENSYTLSEPSRGFIDILDRRTTVRPTTTVKPVNDDWSYHYGNKNPYSLPSSVTRTFSVETEPTPPPTTTTTSRVYLVYPMKNYGNNETDYGPVYRPPQHKSEPPKHRPTEASQKLKGTNSKKATEDDFKKRIKSEIEFGDSQEDLNVRDVEMYTPTIEKFLPNAGKDIRLKPLSSHLDGYIEMRKPNGEWGLVCDKDYGWMINEANVVCKELGYGRGAQISWQGYPLDSSTESIPVSVSEITCNGNENSLKDCLIQYGDNNCDITKNAAGLRCFDNVTTQCHPEEIEYQNNCYRLVKRDDFDDVGFAMEEAAEYCNKIGGRISDVISQDENDFLSQWLMEKHPDVRTVMTGGIGSEVMGRPLWMWFSSKVPMIYQNWWKGWADDNKVKQGTVHEPSCVVLRKSYPCFVRTENEAQVEIELGNLDPEYCSANYFYWDVEGCKNIKEMKLPYLCKKPLENIGCVVGRGENYTGTASVTSSGLPCLAWDHPEVKSKLAHQITLQEWSTKLSGHNFCRNLGRQELHPWCFVEGKENSEYCSIPQCWDSVPGYSKSATVQSTCDETQFECKSGECISRIMFCDGKKDCSNGRDEAMCRIFLQEFANVPNKKMKGHGKEEWPGVNENTCAKLCLENKKFKCKSFSYHPRKRSCLLSDLNVGLSGQVRAAEGWMYHELSSSSLNCSLDKGLITCRNGKCVNVSNICDGKDHCGDGSDEVDCDRLGYEIRLAGSNETNRGRVEVKVLGKWGAICDDKFNLQAGEVVCRELGFKHGIAEVLLNSQFPLDNPMFLVDDLECIGNETSIRECSFPGWGRHDCRPEETVGVVCRVPETTCPDDQWHCKKSKECVPIRFLCDKVPDCDDESDEDEKMCNEPVKIRLAGGPNQTSGRLEIRYLGTWGTVCDDNFNDAAASVICRVLGYHGPSYAFKNAHFGPGKGPIWLDGVQCFGNETNVGECDHSEWGRHNCKHDEDISISCSKLTGRQKSSARKPIAASSDDNLEQTSVSKLKQVLLKECSDDKNVAIESIPIRSEPRARVVGSDVVIDGIPWQASVRVRSPGGKSSHWCGAIVISPYHILTAGHCLRDYSKPAYYIRVGDFDTEVEDPEEQEFGIDHLYTHPEFNRKLHLNNDIALVKIKGEIRQSSRVRPACLAPTTDIYVPGKNCSISGWGSISPLSKGYARTLRRAYVPILEPSLCRAPFVYGNSLSDGMFCAGKLDGGVDSCQGDSGGPIMCEHEGRLYLFGITSWGHGCGRANKPGVYTNVAYYSQWIQEKIELSLA